MTPLARKMFFNHGKLNFAVTGEMGGIHFHVRTPQNAEDDTYSHGDCGIEIHSRSRLYSHQGDADDARCWLLGSPCWHDGSTLIAREHYLPLYKVSNTFGDFESLFRALELEYDRRFRS